MVEVKKKKLEKPKQEVITSPGVDPKVKQRIQQQAPLGFAGGQIAGKVPLQKTAEQEQAEAVKGEQKAREIQSKAVLDEKRFFEEKVPTRTELDVPQVPGSGVPVLGAVAGALGQASQPGLTTNGVPLTNTDFGTKEDIQPLIQNPETARELALQAIQKKVIKQGTTASEKFGARIEAIPVVGTLASKYASGLIEDPKGNVDTLVKEIQSERERASVLAEKAATGKLGNPIEAYDLIEDIEENIIRAEQRIKLLSLESAQLRSSADELNRIEEVILRSKERVFIAKQAAAAGMVAPSTDSNIYLTLKDL